MSTVLKNFPIPSEWDWCQAQDCMDVRDGTHDSPKYIAEGYPLVTSKNLIDGEIDFSTCSYISKEDHDAISKRSGVDDGDILYAMIGTIGNPVIVDKQFEFSIKNVALFQFNDGNVFNKYIYYFLESELTKRQFENRSRGGTQKFVSLTNIRELMIPLPPLAEQQKIAAILDAADQLRQKDQQLIDHYTQLSQSLFLQMFGDPVMNPMGWGVTELGGVIGPIESGWSPVCEKEKRNSDNEWAVLKLSAVGNGVYNQYENKQLSKEHAPKLNIEVKDGDLLISRKNTDKLVGTCAYVFSTKRRLMIPDTIFRLQCNMEKCTSIFLWFLLKHKGFSQRVRLLATGSAGSMPNISKAKLNNFEIPLPPIESQNQFAQHIEKIEQQKQQAQASLEKSQALFNSLLQRAFKGELTRSDSRAA